MKIPGVVYENPGVQSLGRDNVRGPLGVAKAKANTASIVAGVAQDRAQTYSKVASDMVSIGGIHQQEARMKDNSAAKTAQYAAEFGANMQNLTNKGMALTVSVIKASAERSFHDVEVLDAETMESIANGPKTMQVDGKTHGMRTVSTAGGMVSAYDAQMAKVKEDALANANPWSRGLLEGMIDDKIAVGRVEMTSFANKEEKAFYTEDVKNIIEEKLDKGDFKGAQEVATNNRGLLGKNYSTYTNAIRDSKDADDLDKKAWAATDRIVAGGGSLDAQVSKAREEPVEYRDEAVAKVTQMYHIKEETARKGREEQKRRIDENITSQMRAVDNGEKLAATMVVPDGATPAVYKATKAWQQSKVKGIDIVTDKATYMKLYDMTPEQLVSENMMEYTDKLDTGDWEKIVERRDAAKSADPSKPIESEMSKLTKIDLNMYLPKDFESSNKDIYAGVHYMATTSLEQEVAERGRPLTAGERANNITRVVQEYTADGGGWFSDVMKAADLKPEAITQITNVLADEGKTPTVENVMGMQQEYLKDRDRIAKVFGDTPYTEAHVFGAWRNYNAIENILVNRGESPVRKEVMMHFNNYMTDVADIREELQRQGVPDTPMNRAAMYLDGRNL